MLMCTTYVDYLTLCVQIDFSSVRRQQIRFYHCYLLTSLSSTMFFILTKIHKNGVRKDKLRHFSMVYISSDKDNLGYCMGLFVVICKVVINISPFPGPLLK